MLPDRKSVFLAGVFAGLHNREGTEIGPPAGLRPAGVPTSFFSRSLSG